MRWCRAKCQAGAKPSRCFTEGWRLKKKKKGRRSICLNYSSGERAGTVGIYDYPSLTGRNNPFLRWAQAFIALMACLVWRPGTWIFMTVLFPELQSSSCWWIAANVQEISSNINTPRSWTLEAWAPPKKRHETFMWSEFWRTSFYGAKNAPWAISASHGEFFLFFVYLYFVYFCAS